MTDGDVNVVNEGTVGVDKVRFGDAGTLDEETHLQCI